MGECGVLASMRWLSQLNISLFWTNIAQAKSVGYRPRSRGVQLGQRAAIYVRVSTTDQSCERQIAELTAFAGRSGLAVLGIFKETASGTRNNRPARSRVLELAQARRIDAVLVTELSRWGRSTQDLLDTLYKLAGWKVSVVAMSGMTFGHRTRARS